MRSSAAFAVVAAVMALLIAGDAVAKSKNSNRNATNKRAWTGITQNPWDFPNCFIWSPKHRYWVWICGEPYPKDMPHR